MNVFCAFKGYEGVLCGSCSGGHANARYGKNASLDCQQCEGGLLQVLYTMFYVATMMCLIASFMKGAKSYAKAVISKGSLPVSQTISLWKREILNTNELDEESDGESLTHSPLVEDGAMTPADILKV